MDKIDELYSPPVEENPKRVVTLLSVDAFIGSWTYTEDYLNFIRSNFNIEKIVHLVSHDTRVERNSDTRNFRTWRKDIKERFAPNVQGKYAILAGTSPAAVFIMMGMMLRFAFFDMVHYNPRAKEFTLWKLDISQVKRPIFGELPPVTRSYAQEGAHSRHVLLFFSLDKSHTIEDKAQQIQELVGAKQMSIATLQWKGDMYDLEPDMYWSAKLELDHFVNEWVVDTNGVQDYIVVSALPTPFNFALGTVLKAVNRTIYLLEKVKEDYTIAYQF